MSDVTAPLPKMPVWQYDGDIVITGASAKMPESENIAEFKENLYSHVDMITDAETRWPAGLYGLPKRLGKLKDLHFRCSQKREAFVWHLNLVLGH